MHYLLSAAFFSVVLFGVGYMSVLNSVYSLFDWSGKTGEIDQQRDSGFSMITGPQNLLQFGKSALGIANTSGEGTKIGVATKVSLFSLFCDALELFFRGNPYYESIVASFLQYLEMIMCANIGGDTPNATAYKFVRLGSLVAKDMFLNQASMFFF